MKKHSYVLKADITQLVIDLKKTYDRLLRRGKIPKNASVSRLSPEHYPLIIDLHHTTFNHETSEILCRLSGTSCVVNYCHQTSTLLLLDHKVIGVILILKKKYEKLAFVYVIIVNVNWRRTWATTYLKYHSFKHLLSCGFEEIAFQAFNGNHDTLKHARRVGAKITADNYMWNA